MSGSNRNPLWVKALTCIILGMGLLGAATRSSAQIIILKPDLVISSVATTVTPIVAPGGKVTLSSWTIRNQGRVAAAGFSNGFYLSTDAVITTADTYLDGNGNGDGLAVGAAFTWGGPSLTIPAATAPGRYYVGILVDRTGAVAESNESNNYVSVPITVATGPDLIISSGAPAASPSSVTPGGTVTLSAWTIKNQGSRASGGFSNRFYLSTDPVITTADTLLGSNGNSVGLAAGATFSWGAPTLVIPVATAPGRYYVGILVDYGNNVSEVFETNNYVSVPVTVGPDLTISSGALTVTPSVVARGARVQIAPVTIKNQGSACSSFASVFYLSTDPVITKDDFYVGAIPNITGLAAGATFIWSAGSLPIPGTIAPGNYYLGLLVDPANMIKEANETNNYVSTPIQIFAKPDLTITSGAPTATPSGVAAGGKVNLSAWTVKNQGTMASSAFSNGIYLSSDAVITAADTYLAGNSNTGLAIGASFTWSAGTVSIPYNTAPGNYYIGILVDRAGAVSESNEANNYVALPIRVLSRPDLVISSGAPRLSRYAVKPGEAVTMTAWTVRNQGEIAAGGFYNGFYLSTDPVINSSDVLLGGNGNGGLDAGGRVNWGGPTLTIPAATAPGNYYIGILVDRLTHVIESNEANNYVAVPIKIGNDDHGNTAATATAIAVGAEVNGAIESAGDADFFKVTLTAGKTYNISTCLWSLADSKLYLYKADGVTQLAYNDDDPLSGGANSRISYKPATTGDYYVKVIGYGTSIGTYTVKTQEAATAYAAAPKRMNK